MTIAEEYRPNVATTTVLERAIGLYFEDELGWLARSHAHDVSIYLLHGADQCTNSELLVRENFGYLKSDLSQLAAVRGQRATAETLPVVSPISPNTAQGQDIGGSGPPTHD